MPDFPSPENIAVAEQVVLSAGNILRAAGFSREEIGSIFRQAADQLDGAPTRSPTPAPLTDPAAALHAEFARIPPVAEVLRLTRSIAPAAALDLRFELAMEILPHIGAAQDWLRSMAESASVPLAAEAGKPSGGPVLMLREFEAIYSPAYDLVHELLAEALAQGREDYFHAVLKTLADNEIILPTDVIESLNRWLTAAG